MRFVADISRPEAERFVIEEAQPVGFYLYVYKGNQCVRDHLEDTLDLAMQVALEDYKVPKASWEKAP